MPSINEKLDHGLRSKPSNANLTYDSRKNLNDPSEINSFRKNPANINTNKNLYQSHKTHQAKSILVNRNALPNNTNTPKTKKTVRFNDVNPQERFKNSPFTEEMINQFKNINMTQCNGLNQYQSSNINIEKDNRIPITQEAYTRSISNDYNQNNANQFLPLSINQNRQIEKKNGEDRPKQYKAPFFNQYQLPGEIINIYNEKESSKNPYIQSLNNNESQNKEHIYQYPDVNTFNKSPIDDFSQVLLYRLPTSNQEEHNKNLYTEMLTEKDNDDDLDYDKKCIKSKMGMKDKMASQYERSYKFFLNSKINNLPPSEQILFENMRSKRSYGIDITDTNNGLDIDQFNNIGFKEYDDNGNYKQENNTFSLKARQKFKNEDLKKKELEMKGFKFSTNFDDYLPIVESTEYPKGPSISTPEMDEICRIKLLKELKNSNYKSAFPSDKDATGCHIM